MSSHRKAPRERVRAIWRVLCVAKRPARSVEIAEACGYKLASTQRYLRAMDRLGLVVRSGKTNKSRYRVRAGRCLIESVLDEARGSERVVPDQIDEEKAIMMAASVWVNGLSVREAGRRASVDSTAAFYFFKGQRRSDLFDVVRDMFQRGKLDSLADGYVDDDAERYLTYPEHGRIRQDVGRVDEESLLEGSDRPY